MAEGRELTKIEPMKVVATNGEATQMDETAEQSESVIEVPALFEYLKSENGHQLANRIIELLESFKKATLDEQVKAKAQQNELAKLALKHTIVIQTIGLFAVVGALVGLSAAGQLRGEAATILGAMAGYLFAQQKKAGI